MDPARISARKYRRWDANTFSLSAENLNHLHKIVPITYYEPSKPYTSRPIVFSKCPKKYRSKNAVPPTQNFDVMKQTQPKGFVFVWPQRKRRRKEEYTLYMKIVSHFFYWWDLLGFFPRGTGVPSKKPPWEIAKPLPKPENRNFIIEPDWNSVYVEA